MRLLTLSLVLFSGAVAIGADPPQVVEVPQPPASKWAEFKAQPGRLLVLSAGATAKWVVIDDGCDLVPVADGKTATFSAPAAGRYRVVCVVGPEPVRCVVIVGTPPEPDPGPGPKPPAPDALVADIKAAFTADGGKLADLQSLSALYTLMVSECASAEYATAADLNARYVAARDTMLKGALPTVRKRCGQEISAAIGSDPSASLTDTSRKAIAACFARLAKAVDDASK